MNEKIINYRIFDPNKKSFFKSKNTDRAELTFIKCSNSENCELFKNNKCVLKIPLFGGGCPYGKILSETGPTKASKSIHKWVENVKNQYQNSLNVALDSPASKMAEIGDYIYLPYAHITMNKEIPFRSHSALFISGSPFLYKEAFTIENIIKIVEFRPFALMGGEITSYRKEEIPRFLNHLREKYNDLFNELIKVKPNYISTYNLSTPKNIGRMAKLKSINFPIEYVTDGSREGNYKVTWQWDGKVLSTNNKYAYNSTWGEFKNIKNLMVVIEPDDNEIIKIQNESWVNSKTEFID